MASRILNRVMYRTRIKKLIESPPTSEEGTNEELEIRAHWAKYNCVLISGFIEQAVKEIFLEHASAEGSTRLRNYIEGTWPNSRNMRCDTIREILRYCDVDWATDFEAWLSNSEKKKEINEIIRWRNDIAHGKEANTTNVTLQSVDQKFHIACDLVDFVEDLLRPDPHV